MTNPTKPQKGINKPSSQNQSKTIVHHEEELSVRYQAPIPPPEFIARYNEILPGSADRILKMAENNAEVRNRVFEQESKANIALAFRGQKFGLVVAIAGLLVACAVAIWGNAWAGGVIGAISLSGMVGQFLKRGDDTQPKEGDSKK